MIEHTKCTNGGCPLRFNCLRNRQESNNTNETSSKYFDYQEFNGVVSCNFYLNDFSDEDEFICICPE